MVKAWGRIHYAPDSNFDVGERNKDRKLAMSITNLFDDYGILTPSGDTSPVFCFKIKYDYIGALIRTDKIVTIFFQ